MSLWARVYYCTFQVASMPDSEAADNEHGHGRQHARAQPRARPSPTAARRPERPLRLRRGAAPRAPAAPSSTCPAMPARPLRSLIMSRMPVARHAAEALRRGGS